MSKLLNRCDAAKLLPLMIALGAACADGAAVPTGMAGQEATPITVEGRLLCLPHRAGQPATFECSIGLRDANGRHYALRNLEEGARVDDRVRLSGRFIPGAVDPYDVVGTIVIESQTRLSGARRQENGRRSTWWAFVHEPRGLSPSRL